MGQSLLKTYKDQNKSVYLLYTMYFSPCTVTNLISAVLFEDELETLIEDKALCPSMLLHLFTLILIDGSGLQSQT